MQLHPTSLPGGRLGREAYAFVDWLSAAGQSSWQMLPLGPPDRYGSPYKAKSAFAAWPGLLAEPRAPVTHEEASAFRAKESFWVDAWARFGPGRANELVADQVRFDREWAALRRYAADRGVRLIGDVPIYVAPGSADQRAHPRLFRDDAVAGVPPDAFTDKGQLWGNPLYDWPALRRDGHYAWWSERFRRTFELYDLARIDHFRGFVAYWAVPRGARDARGGTWKRGPGRAVFDAAGTALGGELPLIAEDLGVITPAVERLRDGLGYPGMVVLQFGFDGDPNSPHLPENHVENRVVYTGTHDHDTIRGWWDGLDAATRARVQASIDAHGVAEDQPEWSLIRLAFASPARLAMVQAQDVLGLGSEAR
ncbi:MAG TPA: 4-alpha-glucanotransferase, partial [Solirubrobacteraceae bacterium]|nr:4-alpha-glucanotransferase [Solirubrobacteraceae bacterium]